MEVLDLTHRAWCPNYGIDMPCSCKASGEGLSDDEGCNECLGRGECGSCDGCCSCACHENSNYFSK